MGRIHGIALLVLGLVILFFATVVVLYSTGSMTLWMKRGSLSIIETVDFSIVTTAYTMGLLMLAWPLVSFWLDTVLNTYGDGNGE